MGVHIFGVIATLCLASYTNAVSNPDIPLTTPQLIQKYGYPVESHTVTTADGYILTMHRIPGSTKSPVALNKPIVFLQHGLFSTSADWIILGPEKSLGYLLADAGYDVWLGNARGNSYSQKHTSLSTSSYKYWSFSWHEMGIYDLPAEFEYVLALTGQKDMFYIGHSMGTTMFYVLMSSRPEYNAKVRYMISLAPIAFMSHTTSTLAKFGSYLPGGQIGLEFLEFLGLGKLTPTNSLMDFLSDNACSENSFTQPICSNIMFMLVGYDPDEVNKTTLPVILSHTPDVASTKTVLHYAQLISSLSDSFRMWDYYALNLVMYKQLTPPAYNLDAITTKIKLFYGDNDVFGDPTDVHTLNNALTNGQGEYEVPFKSFNHQDFLWANDVKTLVNDEILNLLSEQK